MKKQLIGAMMLVAALIVTGCKNKNNKPADPAPKDAQEQTNEEMKKENRMLIIVDPQVDFTTGSLATVKGPEAMDCLAQAIDNGLLDKYTWVVVTQDAHPANHCSFKENGGDWPTHCVQGTLGMEVYPALKNALDQSNHGNIDYMTKGDLTEKDEYSIFQNARSGEKLTKTIKDEKFIGIDICGIATDYCVFETTKDLTAIYPGNQIRIATNCIAAVHDNNTKLADLMKEKGIEAITF